MKNTLLGKKRDTRENEEEDEENVKISDHSYLGKDTS